MTRGPRCPDCTLAHRQVDDRKRLARITQATPPATTFDGQLQRMRDKNRAVEAGEDLDEDEDEELLDEENASDEEVDEIADEVLEVVHPSAPVARKPEHRQAPKPKERVTGELPWWATRGREGFTAAAEAKSEAMTADAKRRGITVEGKVNT